MVVLMRHLGSFSTIKTGKSPYDLNSAGATGNRRMRLKTQESNPIPQGHLKRFPALTFPLAVGTAKNSKVTGRVFMAYVLSEHSVPLSIVNQISNFKYYFLS